MPEEQSRAEVVFEEYLKGQGITWEYETLPGQKQPDYLIPHAGGKCVVEVKLIEGPDSFPTKGFNPDKFVRAKIGRARKQFREYKDLLCALAVYSESMFGKHEPSILLSAAFAPGHQQAGRDYGKLDPSASYYHFSKRSELPENRHFLADAMLSPVANTTFSALILISRHRIRAVDLEGWKRRYAQQEAGLEMDNQFDLLSKLFPEYGQSFY